MFLWITENIVTILICFVLVAIVAAVIAVMVRDKKKGKSCCGGNCGCCPMGGSCHSRGNGSGRQISGIIKITLKIDGMMCGMCEAHVKDAIRRAFPVKKVSASRRKKEAVLISENDIDENALREAVEKTGYTVLAVTKAPDRSCRNCGDNVASDA